MNFYLVFINNLNHIILFNDLTGDSKPVVALGNAPSLRMWTSITCYGKTIGLVRSKKTGESLPLQ